MTAPPAHPLAGSEIGPLLEGSAEFLGAVYDERQALFPYSTLLRDGAFVNDYAHPQTRRYTINTLLGIEQAVQNGIAVSPALTDVDACVERFVARHQAALTSPADLGLMLVLDATTGSASGGGRDALRRVTDAIADRSRLTIQDLSWMLWGATAASRTGIAEAEVAAERLFSAITTEFVDPRSGLPRHTLNPLRRHVVSFGGIVYFLRAMAEYASLTGSRAAESLFRRGVATTLDLQGPQGEWPWMIDNRTGVPLDLYPVFGVHQDAMAMLFLFPALDRGLEGVPAAIRSSLAWSLGENQLGLRMYLDEPFFAYRSIHRKGRALRARRYLRSLRPRRAVPIDSDRVRVNRECRSYHLGWLLYAWAGRSFDIGGEVE